MDDYLTTEQVAQRFHTAPSTVRYWRHIGTGPQGVRIGRRVLYPVAGVQRWVEEQGAAEAERRQAASA